MRLGLRFALLTIFLIGLVTTGLVGTSTSMTFVWPLYLLLGLAGMLSIATLFSHVDFTLPRAATITLLLLAVYLLVRAADSPVAYFAREDVGLIVASLLVYCGFLTLCPNASARRAVILSLAALVAANLLMALAQHFIDPGLWLIPGYERTVTESVGGLFNQPDHFAIFLAALLPLWLSLLLFGREERRLRFVWSALAIGSGLTLLLTWNLAGLLTAGAGVGGLFLLLVFVVWKRLKPKVRRNALLALPLLVLGIAGLVFAFSDTLGRELGGGTIAEDGRANLPLVWKSGLRQVGESPWLGTGSRSSYIYSRAYRSPELGAQVGEPEFAHNEFIQIAADYGIIGLLLLLAALGFHAWNGFQFLSAFQSWRGSRGRLLPQSGHLALAAGMLSVLASLATAACFDFVLHLPVFALLAAIALALLAVPDPMAKVLPPREEESFLPGGSLLFSLRAVGFGCGIAMVTFGLIFSRSEYHYEMARLAFEGEPTSFRQFPHLQEARALDPKNPYAFSLSAHAQVAGITPDMPEPARRQALETADRYFDQAYRLYPQDVFAAVGHAFVLDELDRPEAARERLAEARRWAPLYGNLILAQAEHHFRSGDVLRAEDAYRDALEADAFADVEGAREGLATIAEWKRIAEQEGIRWNDPDSGYPDPAGPLIPDANVVERDLAGKAEDQD